MGTLIAAINLQDSFEQREALLSELKTFLCPVEKENFGTFFDHPNNTYICHRHLQSYKEEELLQEEQQQANQCRNNPNKQPYSMECENGTIAWAMIADIYNFTHLVRNELTPPIQEEIKSGHISIYTPFNIPIY